MTPKEITGLILVIAVVITIFALVSTAFTLYSISTMLDSGFIEKRLIANSQGVEIDCNPNFVEQALKIKIDETVLYCTIS